MPTVVVLSANTFHILDKKGNLPTRLPPGAISKHVEFAPPIWLVMTVLISGYLGVAICQSRTSLSHRHFAPLGLAVGIFGIHYLLALIACHLTVGELGDFLEPFLDP